MPNSLKRVMIIIFRADSFGANMVKGIIDYSKLVGNWEISTQLPPYLEENNNSPLSLSELGYDGAIAYIPNEQKANSVSFKGIAAVTAHNTKERDLYGFPYIVCNNKKIGQIASEFYHERGFRNLAFIGFKEFEWSEDRKIGFIEKNNQYGYDTECFLYPKAGFSHKDPKERKRVIDWLHNCPKPLAILTANDDLGLYLIQICRDENIAIPDEISILGVDNNEVDCNLTSPPLSSISYDSQQAGFTASKTLDIIMNGGYVKERKILINPIKIIKRQSTDIYAVEDEDVLAAINFIKKNCRGSMQVEDVARAVNMSRRNLSRKFKQFHCRSIYDEIRLTCVEEISRTLTDTNLSISKIAFHLGFTDHKHFSRYFKSQTGVTPIEYRKKDNAST